METLGNTWKHFHETLETLEPLKNSCKREETLGNSETLGNTFMKHLETAENAWKAGNTWKHPAPGIEAFTEKASEQPVNGGKCVNRAYKTRKK